MAESSSIKSPWSSRLAAKAVHSTIMVSSLAIMIFNVLFAGSMELGLVSTVVFLSSIGAICGWVLYEDDPSTLRFLKGFFTVLILMTVSGVFANYVNRFDLVASLLITSLWSAIFLVFFLRKFLRTGNSPSQAEVSGRASSFLGWLTVSLFGIVLVVLFFTLFNSRTTEPMFDIWHNIPVALFLFLVFASSSMIVSLILFKRGSHVQLLMTVAISVLIEGIYYLVWYPSLYGDPLITLGYARYVYRTGSIFDWQYLVSARLWPDIIKGRGFPVFTAHLTRLLNFDIYWVHNIVSPLLWSIVVPISLYEITCLLVEKNTRCYPREALLSAFAGALLIPVLMVWGANPTGNTLGFLFLFFSIPLTLRWASQGGRLRWILAFMASVASFMTHPMPGIFGIVFLLGAMIFRETTNTRERLLAFALSSLVLPLVLVLIGARFMPEGLVSVQNAVNFEASVLTFSMFLAVVGLLLSLRFFVLNRPILSLLASFYIIVVADFYLSQYGLTSVPYGADRALVVAEFLLAPFIGFLIYCLPRLFGRMRKSIGQGQNAASKLLVRRIRNRTSVFAVLIVLLISFQSAASVYQAFPQNEVGVAPSVYEMEAVYYLSSAGTGDFVVVSDTLFSNIAIGLLGVDWGSFGEHQRGGFGTSSWDFELQKKFFLMVKEPSLDILEGAKTIADVDFVYFVISIRNPSFNETVGKMMELLPVHKIFGDGKLYVFKYPVPQFTGTGPDINIVYDDGALTEKVWSEYSYTMKKDVTYSVEVIGHKTYNISNYPLYWVFKNITYDQVYPQAYDNSSDVNDFIYVKDVDQSRTLKVSWAANDEYPFCGWKEDSFREGWGPYPAYVYKMEPIIRTGDVYDARAVLSLSGVFTAGSTPEAQEDFYYAKPANVSTDQYPYLAIRWKSTNRVTVSYVYYEDWSNQEIIRFSSVSDSWTSTRVKLVPGKRIQYVMVGLSDLGGGAGIMGTQTLYVDYILICNSAS